MQAKTWSRYVRNPSRVGRRSNNGHAGEWSVCQVCRSELQVQVGIDEAFAICRRRKIVIAKAVS